MICHSSTDGRSEQQTKSGGAEYDAGLRWWHREFSKESGRGNTHGLIVESLKQRGCGTQREGKRRGGRGQGTVRGGIRGFHAL